MKRLHTIGVLLGGIFLLTSVVGAKKVETITLKLPGSFMPDPHVMAFETVGTKKPTLPQKRNLVDEIMGKKKKPKKLPKECVGFISEPPNVMLDYVEPSSILRVFVESKQDTALIIYTPEKEWACIDDAAGTGNPMWTFKHPDEGRYFIWISTQTQGEKAKGEISFTELLSRKPKATVPEKIDPEEE